jgi:SAM-dependent methyltransferase
MDEPLPIAGFDCIVTIAMLHHLPLIPALERLSTLLAPGGVLLVLDLYRPRQLRDALWQAVAVPTSIALNLTRCGRIRPSAEHRAAWAEHGRRDLYPTIAEVGRAALLCLPGAQLKRHLLWRYSLVWRKSDDWPATAEALGTHPTRMQP